MFGTLPGLAAATVAMLAVLVVPAVEAQSPALFTPVEAPPPSGPRTDITLRSRVVTLDLGPVQHAHAVLATPPGPPTRTRDAAASVKRADSVSAPGTTLTFNLFDDVVVTGVVERTAPTFSGGYSVSGHLVEEPLGTLTLVVNGATVVGTVRLPGETYHIRSIGDGLYAISEVEEPPLDCGVDDSHAETDHRH